MAYGFIAANTRTAAKKLEGYTCCYPVVCKFFVFCFWFSSRFTLGFYCAYLYMLISRVRKELSHSDWLFVVNLRLTHEPCLGITMVTVSLYSFGSPRCKFSNYSSSEQRSGHITEIANYSYPILTIIGSPDVNAASVTMFGCRDGESTCLPPV